MEDVSKMMSDKLEQRANLVLSKKMILWIFIISIIMMFGAWTSAYLFKRSEGGWYQFEMPTVMYFSTLVLVLSSVTMHLAYLSGKKDNLERLKIELMVTLILALIFILLQYFAFKNLIDRQIYFTGKSSSVSASFLYILTLIHALHIVAGIVFLLVTLFKAFANKVHSREMLVLEMCTTFWHFLDGLWVYLFVFLYFNR